MFKSNLISILIERDNSVVFVPTLHKSHLCFYCLTDTIEHRGGPQPSPTLNQGFEGRAGGCVVILLRAEVLVSAVCVLYIVWRYRSFCHVIYHDTRTAIATTTLSQSLSLVSPNSYYASYSCDLVCIFSYYIIIVTYYCKIRL